MVNINKPSLPKFDTTSLNADLANKIKPPELQPRPDGSGNLRSMIKDQSKQLGTNIEGTLGEFDKNAQAQAEQLAASVEAEAKKIEEGARAAAKMIEDEFKRKKEEAKELLKARLEKLDKEFEKNKKLLEELQKLNDKIQKEEDDNDIINLFENYEITKLDINRIYRYLEKYTKEDAQGNDDVSVDECSIGE